MSTWHTTVPAVLADLHEPTGPRPLPRRKPGTPKAPLPLPQRLAGLTTAALPAAGIRIVGTLISDAEWRTTGGAKPIGMVHVLIEQAQQRSAVAIRATQVVGTDPLAHLAGASRARRLTKGTVVVVEGAVLVPHPSSNTIELFGVATLQEYRLPSLDQRIEPLSAADAVVEGPTP